MPYVNFLVVSWKELMQDIIEGTSSYLGSQTNGLGETAVITANI